MIEISITVKNEDSRLNKKFMEYSKDIKLSLDDPTLIRLRDEVIKDFGAPVDDCVMRITMSW